MKGMKKFAVDAAYFAFETLLFIRFIDENNYIAGTIIIYKVL